MFWRLVAVVGLLLLAAVAADLLPLTEPGVQHLQIHNDRIVAVYAGNPGKWLRMRVRSDTAQIYLFQHSSVYSQSWKPLPITDAYGQPMIRETLVLGSAQFRADIVVGRFPDETPVTVEGTQAEGVLGIGATSPLWTVWRNYTKSRDLLSLGQVLHLKSDMSEVALPAALPPPWAYGLGIAPSTVTEYVAVLTEDSRHELQHACRVALGSIIDDSADYAHTDAMLASVLGVQPDEQLCSVASEYRLLLVPDSDYNIVPRALLMHSLNKPPMFHLRSTLAPEPTLLAVLFNRHDDMYIEMDTTNRAGAGVRRMANRARPGTNNTIVLGEYGLRRFDLGYDLDTGRAFLSIKHNGLAHSSMAKATEHSIEVRRFVHLYVLIGGLLLWAIQATEPDPVYPRHRHYVPERDRYPHSHRAPTIQPTTPIVPTVQAVRADPTSFTVAIRTTQGASILGAPPDLDRPESPGEDTPEKVSAAESRQRQLDELAHETTVRVAAVLRASFRMRSEWPFCVDTLYYVQALSEGVAAVYFIMALGFYDSTWALSLVLNSSATTTALGWTTMAILIAALVALSMVAMFAAGRDARLGSLAMQCETLIAIYVLLVAMYQWDLALALLFVVSALITVVLIVGTLSACGIVPQYQQHIQRERRALWPPMVMVTVAWFLYSALGLFPFIVDRLWDNKNQSTLISLFLVIGIALPLALYTAFGPFVYPLLVANATCHRIFTAAQQRYSAITGAP